MPKEIKIQSALLAPAPQQATTQSFGRKSKQIELETQIKVPGLECIRSLPENVPFVNNMVIEDPELSLFFIDAFGDQAFQRWGDKDRVELGTIVGYMVMAYAIKTLLRMTGST